MPNPHKFSFAETRRNIRNPSRSHRCTLLTEYDGGAGRSYSIRSNFFPITLFIQLARTQTLDVISLQKPVLHHSAKLHSRSLAASLTTSFTQRKHTYRHVYLSSTSAEATRLEYD